jgi:hypothetical protein
MTNKVSTPLWFTFRKSVEPLNFDCLSRLQTPIKLDIDKYVTLRIVFCKCLPHLLSYSNLYLSLSSVICLSYFTHDSFSLTAPESSFSFSTPADLLYLYQMLLTSLIRKHVFSYFSENSFGSSKQIMLLPVIIWMTIYTYMNSFWETTSIPDNKKTQRMRVCTASIQDNCISQDL